jgi:hypothetical protein
MSPGPSESQAGEADFLLDSRGRRKIVFNRAHGKLPGQNPGSTVASWSGYGQTVVPGRSAVNDRTRHGTRLTMLATTRRRSDHLEPQLYFPGETRQS